MPTDSADIETLERLLATRRSCRGFTDEPVEQAVIERLLTAAQRTPSWCNTQPWEVVVTSGDATEKLRAALMSDARYGSDVEFPPGYEGVLQERRREVGWQLYEAVGVAKGDREASAREMLRNFELFGAPHVAIVHAPASLGAYGLVDCGLYVDTFLLAAQALGLGACAQAAVAGRSELLHEWFDLPDDRRVVCGISFGHADPDHASAAFTSRRADLSDVVRFES